MSGEIGSAVIKSFDMDMLLESDTKKETSQLISSHVSQESREGPTIKMGKITDLQVKPEDEEMGDEEDGSGDGAGIIIPDEVLMAVFENLTTPKDMFNVAKTCHRFRKLISQQEQLRKAQGLIHVLPYLPKGDILNVRLVSSLWSQRVDSTLQNHCRPQHWRSPDLEHLTNSINAKRFRPMRITSTAALHAKQDAFQGIPRDLHQRNPFVLRWLSLNCKETQVPVKIFWHDVILFVKQFGHFIHHLNLTLGPFQSEDSDDSDENSSDSEGSNPNQECYYVYGLLLEIIRMTPNLKSLELQFHEEHTIMETSDVMDFSKYLDLYPIMVQALPHLKSLYLTGSPEYFQIQKNALRQLSGQLKKIVIGKNLEFSLMTLLGCSDGGGDEGFSFDKLRDLTLNVTDPNLVIKVLGKLNAPKLRKFELDMDAEWRNPRILETFNILSRFPSLECIWWRVEVRGIGGIVGHLTGAGGGGGGVSIKPLKSLRFLELCHFHGLPYTKLFEGMPVVEEVTIFGRKKGRSPKPVDEDIDKVIDMGKGEDFWGKLAGKKLERFVVKEYPGFGVKTLFCGYKGLVESSGNVTME